MTNDKNTFWRTTVISLFCFAVIMVCYTYGVQRGLNTRMTAGVLLDASSITVALSRLWFHLHEGYVGYQAVYDALIKVLAPDGLSNNPDNFALLRDPTAIQHAFDNVRKIIPGSLPSYSVLSPEFKIILMEDLGLSDFYTMAFMLFGVHPDSMYKLYFLIFSISALLFLVEYRKQFIPLLLMAAVIAVLPIFFFSDLFNISMPSVNSNRFLSTLGFIPITYILCLYFKSEKSLGRMQVIRLITMALILAFALSIRRSAQWQLIALTTFTLMVALKHYWPYRRHLMQLERLRLLKTPLLAGTLILILVVSGYQAIQRSMMNPIYKTDYAAEGHAVWHSSYIGLSLHPDWVKLNPGITANIDNSDMIAFGVSVHYLEERGVGFLAPLTGGLMYRLHEIVIKQQFFSFIRHHKLFALELYCYYKPMRLISVLFNRVLQINIYCLLFLLLASIIAGCASAHFSSDEIKQVHLLKPTIVASLFLFLSVLPELFAYPTAYSDDIWMLGIYCIFVSGMISYCCFMLLKNRNLGNHREIKDIAYGK